jgi:hypothetical protein
MTSEDDPASQVSPHCMTPSCLGGRSLDGADSRHRIRQVGLSEAAEAPPDRNGTPSTADIPSALVHAPPSGLRSRRGDMARHDSTHSERHEHLDHLLHPYPVTRCGSGRWGAKGPAVRRASLGSDTNCAGLPPRRSTTTTTTTTANYEWATNTEQRATNSERTCKNDQEQRTTKTNERGHEHEHGYEYGQRTRTRKRTTTANERTRTRTANHGYELRTRANEQRTLFASRPWEARAGRPVSPPQGRAGRLRRPASGPTAIPTPGRPRAASDEARDESTGPGHARPRAPTGTAARTTTMGMHLAWPVTCASAGGGGDGVGDGDGGGMGGGNAGGGLLGSGPLAGAVADGTDAGAGVGTGVGAAAATRSARHVGDAIGAALKPRLCPPVPRAPRVDLVRLHKRGATWRTGRQRCGRRDGGIGGDADVGAGAGRPQRPASRPMAIPAPGCPTAVSSGTEHEQERSRGPGQRSSPSAAASPTWHPLHFGTAGPWQLETSTGAGKGRAQKMAARPRLRLTPRQCRHGTAQLSSARLDTTRLGSARLGSARPNSTQLPARLSSQLGSAQLGSAQLGSA